MTSQLNWAQTEQVATANPSPPAVVSSNDGAPARPAKAAVAKTVVPQSDPLDSLKAVSAQIESYLRSVGRTLDFRVDEQTGHPVITVRDAQSGDVIRQIPNEEALRLARSLGARSNALVDLIA